MHPHTCYTEHADLKTDIFSKLSQASVTDLSQKMNQVSHLNHVLFVDANFTGTGIRG